MKHIYNNLTVRLCAAFLLIFFIVVGLNACHNSKETKPVDPAVKEVTAVKQGADPNGLVLYTSVVNGEIARTVFVKNVLFCVERHLVMQSAFINSAPRYDGTKVTNSTILIAKYDTVEKCKEAAVNY
jgi:hypothetical protein